MDRFTYYLNRYRKTVATDSKKARDYIKKLNYKDDFYLLCCIAQTYLDESRFIEKSAILRKTVDFRKWRMAENYIIKAFDIDSNNAEVLYTMGKIRKLNGQYDIAIYCYEKLIKIGVRSISEQKYSRGIAFAKELVNDARFELYRLHFDTNPNLSKKYLSCYKKYLRIGVDTIFKPLDRFLL